MFWIIGGEGIVHSFAELTGWTLAIWASSQLEHVAWDGFVFYDMIFPLFLFIAGVAMPFSLTKRAERGEDRRKLMIHVVRRGLMLVVLGVVYNNGLFMIERRRNTIPQRPGADRACLHVRRVDRAQHQTAGADHLVHRPAGGILGGDGVDSRSRIRSRPAYSRGKSGGLRRPHAASGATVSGRARSRRDPGDDTRDFDRLARSVCRHPDAAGAFPASPAKTRPLFSPPRELSAWPWAGSGDSSSRSTRICGRVLSFSSPEAGACSCSRCSIWSSTCGNTRVGRSSS